MIKLIAWMVRKFIPEDSDVEDLFPVLAAVASRLPVTEKLVIHSMLTQEDWDEMAAEYQQTGEYQHVNMLA